ncbi:recombinase family protein [Nocardioides sp. MAHUQ-72]|uniref:recombinase family protein n=1 Tax=unclassified Nocardioides TaxID=2615069 RepID=UPI00360CDF66
MPTKPKRALIYGRVSKPRPRNQHDDGSEDLSESVDRQITACKYTAASRGYEVVAVERDTQSAYAAKRRPGWERAKRMVERGEVDVVIAWQMDRITRSVAELEQVIDLMESTGASIVTSMGDLDLTTANGRMVARILGAVARAEVELKTARMQLANQTRASEGKRRRSSPRLFGYNADGTINESEAEAVRNAARDLLAGASLYSIAKRWTEAGLFPESRARIASGTAPSWSARGVRDCLTNPRHAGLAVYRGEALEGVRGDWEPIFDEETHISLKALFADPSRRKGDHRRGRKPGDRLLSTVARCGSEGCTRTISASSKQGVPTYVCRSGHVTIPVHKVDMVVTAALVRDLTLLAVQGGLRVSEHTEVDTSELERLRERLDALAEPYADGAITLTQFTRATKSLQDKIAAVECEIAEGSTRSRTLSAEEAWSMFESADIEGKRELLRGAFDIVISPVGKGQRVDALKQVSVTPRNVPAGPDGRSAS